MLGAASEQLKIPVSEMHLENGQVIASGKAYPMGSFVELASQRPVPSDTPVKDPADFLYIGKDLLLFLLIGGFVLMKMVL